MEAETLKTAGLLAAGAVLGVIVMRASMKAGKHSKLGAHFAAAGGGVAAGATVAHLLAGK